MTFPEFQPDKKKVLYFSRGRGRGHVIADIEIIGALQKLREDIDSRLVTYGTGAATAKQLGALLIDLGLPDSGSIADTSVLAGKLIGWLNPDLVISHEEFAAAPAAKIFDKRMLFLTDWFAAGDSYAMAALKFADEILFLGSHGVFEEPPWLRGKVRYLGPLRRRFRFAAGDRLSARSELGIPEQAFVLGVFPGSWPEAEAPIFDMVVAAFDALDYPQKRLVWLAGSEFDWVRSRLEGRAGAQALEHDWQIDRWMVASDAAITKSNRKTVFELHDLGVPAMAISFGLNPADDQAVAAVPNVVALAGRDVDGARLAREIEGLLKRPLATRHIRFCSAEDCAELINDALEPTQPIAE